MKFFTWLCALFLVAVCLPSVGLAQTTVEIATGAALTPTHHSGPIYRSSASSAYDYSRYAYIYTAAELSAAGLPTDSSIIKLAWNKTNAGASTGPGQFKIYLKNSSTANYTVNTNWVDLIAGADLVFDQAVSVPAATGYFTFTFNTPFTYTGGSLEIMVDWDCSAVSGNPSTDAFSWALNTVTDQILGTCNSTATGVATLSTTTNSIGSIDNTRPAIQITYGPPPACPSPTGLTVTGVTATAATANWTDASGSAWDLYLSTSSATPASSTTPTVSVSATTHDFTALNSGTAYYLWVRSDCTANDDGVSDWVGGISFNTLPANDNCADAITLTPSANLTCGGATAGNTTGSTQSAETAPSCSATGVNDDIWYKFTATSTSHIISITGATNTTAAACYSGACGALTQVTGACGTTSSGSVGVAANGLTIGQEYKVRVYSSVSTAGTWAAFNICILTLPPVPANNDCAGAFALPVSTNGSPMYTAVVTASATQSTPNPSCTTTGNDDDVWYTFTTGASTMYRFRYNSLTAATGTASTIGFDAYTGACGALTAVTTPIAVCNTGFGTGGSGFRFVELPANTTIKLRLWVGSSPNSGSFNFAIEEIPLPLANDNCSGAIAMPAIPSDGTCATITGSTGGATQSEVACTGTANDDVWFSFVATQPVNIIECTGITGGPTTDLVFQVFSGACGSQTSLLCSDPVTGTVSGLIPGNTYYIRVFTWSATVNLLSDFTLCVKQAPNMSYVSSNTVQASTANAGAGEANIQTIRLDVVVIGANNALSVSNVKMRTQGTTNVDDLKNAKLFYTTTSTFSSANQFGATIVNPDGLMEFVGTQALNGGTGTANTTNYFWLVYELECNVTAGNLADGLSQDFVLSSTTYVPAVIDPAGARTLVPLSSYSTIADGNWNDPAIWACGVPPNGATAPVYVNSNVMLNVNADINDSIFITAGKTLTVNNTSLVVGNISSNDGGDDFLSVGGGLVISGTGSVKVNGRVTFVASGSFNMSGGELIVDGNGSGGSITTSTQYLLDFRTNLVTISGGTVTIVDPHASTTTTAYAFYYSATGSVIPTGGTFRFGDGVSTTAGGHTNGFYLYPGSSGANRFYFWNTEIKGGSANNRHTRNFYDFISQNLMTIDAGCEHQTADDVWIHNGFVNEGTFVNNSTSYYLYLAIHGPTGAAQSNPNITNISGSGTYRNGTVAAATANMMNLYLDNTSGTPVLIPANMITGVGTGSIQTNLKLMNGKLDLQNQPLILGISTTSVGTLNSGLTNPTGYMIGKFERYMTATTGSRQFPIGTATNNHTANINFTTAPTAAGRISFLFKSIDPGDAGLPLTDTSGTNPTVSEACATGFWEFGGTITGGNFNLDVAANGFTCLTNVANARIIKRADDASNWTLEGTHLDGTGTTVKRNAFGAGFAQFGVGQGDTPPVAWYADDDADTYGDPNDVVMAGTQPAGYVANNTDCNDANAAVNPGAAETCNGVDNNCSGDETDATDQSTFYADTDGDTYGNAASTQTACTAPGGFVANNTDCDDTDALDFPGGVETCNDDDEDCDGTADNGLPTNDYFLDSDGDDYGTGTPVNDCASPGANYSTAAGDCDDNDDAINPGAQEVCGNGTDENCDTFDGIGSFDVDIVKVTTACTKFNATISNVIGAAPGALLYSKDGGTTWVSSPTFLNLVPSSYTFAVKDASNCTKTQVEVINAPMTLGVTGDDLLCFGDTDGEISVSINDGFPPYSIEWKKGTTVVGTTETVTGLGKGVYKAYVTDDKGCIKISGSAEVTSPTKVLVSLLDTDETCFAAADGSVSNNTTGGTPGYTFAWSSNDGSGFSATSQNLLNLHGPATYTVTVSDMNGCSATKSALVKGATAPLTITSITTKPVACLGGSNGSATAKITGGNAGLKTFTWTPGGQSGQSGASHTALNLAAGTYTVSVSDVNGCGTTGTATVIQPSAPLNIAVGSVTPTGTTYKVIMTATGGFTPYKYRRSLDYPATIWSAPNIGTFTLVPAGTYTFQVNDGGGAFSATAPKGCIAGADFSIPGTFKPSVSEVRGEASADFTLVPNPAKGSVFVDFGGQLPTVGDIEIRDAKGSLIQQINVSTLTNSGSRIALEGLNSGVFFVTLRQNGLAPTTKRLVVLN